MKKYVIFLLLLLPGMFAKAQTKDTSTSKGKGLKPAEHTATFPGGIEKLYAFIAANIKYPEVAKKANVQGKVEVRFVIDTNGSIADVKIIKGLSPEINAEAVRLIKSTANWIPGTQNGKPVRSTYTLPITFALQ